MASCLVTLLVLGTSLATAEAGWCWNKDDDWFTRWCTHGCCGDDSDQCCTQDNDELTGGDIAGIVIGSLIALAVCIGGIVLLVYFLKTNCFQKTNRGVVFSGNACANTTPQLATTNINMATYPTQPVVTRPMYYPAQQQPTAIVYNAGYM